MIVTFSAPHVRHLLALSRAATDRTPTDLQTINPAYWRDDLSAERRQRLTQDHDAFEASHVAHADFPWSARAHDIDSTKLPAGLVYFTSDQGIHLKCPVPSATVNLAIAADPDFAAAAKDSGYADIASADLSGLSRDDHENAMSVALSMFGGDHGEIFLHADDIGDDHLDGDTLRLQIGAIAIEILSSSIDHNTPSM